MNNTSSAQVVVSSEGQLYYTRHGKTLFVAAGVQCFSMIALALAMYDKGNVTPEFICQHLHFIVETDSDEPMPF